MSKDEKALIVRDGGFDLLNPADLPEFDESDNEGYNDSDFQAFTYVRIRQKAKNAEDGRTVIAPAGGFEVRNEVFGDVPDLESLQCVILADKQHARTHWEDDKPDCKSLDGINGTNPMTGEDCGKCAICPHAKKQMDDQTRCKPTPIFVVFSPDAGGLAVVTFTVSARKPIGVFYKKLELKARELKMTAKRLPPHFVWTEIRTVYKEKPQPHFVPDFNIVRAVSKDGVAEIRQMREQLTGGFDVKVDAFEDFDTSSAREAAKIEDDSFDPQQYEAEKDKLPFDE